MKKIGCIIQARMGSIRLPGKIMENVDGKNPLLYYVINQIQSSELIDKIVIATTTLQEDNVIVDYVKKLNIEFFRGSEKNVLDRYYQCAKKFSFPIIVRITSDAPLIDPKIVDDMIRFFKNNSYDYVTNTQPRTYPQGTETEIFTFEALESAWNKASKSSEKEHVTPYFYMHPNEFRIFNFQYNKDISNLRWCVDRENDLELVRKLVSKIKTRPIYLNDILRVLSEEPNLIEINSEHTLNEGYLKSLKEDM